MRFTFQSVSLFTPAAHSRPPARTPAQAPDVESSSRRASVGVNTTGKRCADFAANTSSSHGNSIFNTSRYKRKPKHAARWPDTTGNPVPPRHPTPGDVACHGKECTVTACPCGQARRKVSTQSNQYSTAGWPAWFRRQKIQVGLLSK